MPEARQTVGRVLEDLTAGLPEQALAKATQAFLADCGDADTPVDATVTELLAEMLRCGGRDFVAGYLGEAVDLLCVPAAPHHR